VNKDGVICGVMQSAALSPILPLSRLFMMKGARLIELDRNAPQKE